MTVHFRAPEKEPGTTRRPWEAAFIEALRQTANVSRAARMAGVGRRTVYDRRKASEAFREAWDDAREEAADLLEAEARRRAVEGIEEPVHYHGEVCGYVSRYSDTLLIFLLKAARPEKYRERYNLEHTGESGGAVEASDARGRLIARLDAIEER